MKQPALDLADVAPAMSEHDRIALRRYTDEYGLANGMQVYAALRLRRLGGIDDTEAKRRVTRATGALVAGLNSQYTR